MLCGASEKKYAKELQAFFVFWYDSFLGLFVVFQHTYNHEGMLVRITVTSRKKI